MTTNKDGGSQTEKSYIFVYKLKILQYLPCPFAFDLITTLFVDTLENVFNFSALYFTVKKLFKLLKLLKLLFLGIFAPFFTNSQKNSSNFIICNHIGQFSSGPGDILEFLGAVIAI